MPVHSDDGTVTAHQPRTPLLGKLRKTTIVVGPKIGTIPLFPLRVDDLDVPVPQPFQVFLDEGTDLNLPDLCRAVTRGGGTSRGRVMPLLLPAQDNSPRGRLDL